MNKNRLLPVALAIVTTLCFSACNVDEITHDCSVISPTYSSHIKSIMDNNCAVSGCHSTAHKANGIDLSSYATVSAEASKE